MGNGVTIRATRGNRARAMPPGVFGGQSVDVGQQPAADSEVVVVPFST